MSHVYFARPIGMLGPIKIGCSRVPKVRLETLAVWSPFPLEIAISIPGDLKLERRLHDRFSSSHSHREWFHQTPELIGLIQKLQGGESVHEAIDLDNVTGHFGDRRKNTWRRTYSADECLCLSYRCRVRNADVKMSSLFGLKPGAHKAIWAILNSWLGSYSRREAGITPTQKELNRLDAYLAEATRRIRSASPNVAVAA